MTKIDLTPKVKKRILELLRKKLLPGEIAKKLGLSGKAVAGYVAKLRLSMSDLGKAAQQREREEQEGWEAEEAEEIETGEEREPEAPTKSKSEAVDAMRATAEVIKTGVDIGKASQSQSAPADPAAIGKMTMEAVKQGKDMDGALLPLIIGFFEKSGVAERNRFENQMALLKKDSEDRTKEIDKRYEADKERDRVFLTAQQDLADKRTQLDKDSADKRAQLDKDSLKQVVENLNATIKHTEEMLESRKLQTDELIEIKRSHAEEMAALKGEKNTDVAEKVATQFMNRIGEPVVNLLQARLPVPKQSLQSPQSSSGEGESMGGGLFGKAATKVAGAFLNGVAGKISEELASWIDQDLPMELVVRTIVAATEDPDIGPKAQMGITFICAHKLQDLVGLLGSAANAATVKILTSQKAESFWSALRARLLALYKEEPANAGEPAHEAPG